LTIIWKYVVIYVHYYLITIYVMKRLTKKQVQYGLRWAVFVMAALTMSVKIAEVSAYNSLKAFVENPDAAAYSTLANGNMFM